MDYVKIQKSVVWKRMTLKGRGTIRRCSLVGGSGSLWECVLRSFA